MSQLVTGVVTSVHPSADVAPAMELAVSHLAHLVPVFTVKSFVDAYRQNFHFASLTGAVPSDPPLTHVYFISTLALPPNAVTLVITTFLSLLLTHLVQLY